MASPTRPLLRPTLGRRHRLRLRPAAAAALVGGLAAAWIVVGQHGGQPTSPAAAATAPTDGLRARLAHPEQCADVAGPMPTVHCVVDGVDIDVRELDANLGAAYAREVRVAGEAHAGPARCAQGQPEERTWSRPDAPARIVGRYACVRAGERAAMWWTDDQGLLWHAIAHDGDLAALFSWWRGHPAL